MTVYRTRKQIKQYDRHRKYIEPSDKGCAFCNINIASPQLVRLTENFKIIRNIFPYSLWDSQPVEDHLLLVPKRHTDTLAAVSPLGAQEFVRLISGYEAAGYNIYARAPGSDMKTIIHQHTHLIKLQSHKIRGLIYLHKPHIRLMIK